MSMIVNVLRNALEKKRYTGRYSIQELLYRIALEQDLQHLEDRSQYNMVSISVTDLVACSHRYRLSMKYPELKIQGNYSPTLILGRVLHTGIESIVKKYWENARIEAPLEKIIMLDDARAVRIAGVADIVVEGDNGKIIIEIKTSRGDHETPLEHHVKQLQIYMNLSGAAKGILFYINPDRIAEYEVNEPLTDSELAQLVLETLLDKKHPRYDWECNYCPYSIMCPYKKINKYKR